MLEKNKEKLKRKNRQTWSPYYTRVTKDKTKYTRKEKHRKKPSDYSEGFNYSSSAF